MVGVPVMLRRSSALFLVVLWAASIPDARPALAQNVEVPLPVVAEEILAGWAEGPDVA